MTLAFRNILLLALGTSCAVAVQAPVPEFRHDIRPVLEKYCFDCHADGANKGNVSFDSFKSEAEIVQQRDLWLRALKNVRAGIMPPSKNHSHRRTKNSSLLSGSNARFSTPI